jgi:predicted nucleic acid-binding protein
MSVLLDSDIVIEILRARDQVILSQWQGLANTTEVILFSPITAAEVWGGVRSDEHEATARFFNLLTCVPIEYTMGQLAGGLLRQFSKSHGLKIADALIAAAAIQHKAALWTRNRKHYPMPQLTFYA